MADIPGQFNPPSRKASADAKSRLNWLRRAHPAEAGFGSLVLTPFFKFGAYRGLYHLIRKEAKSAAISTPEEL